MREDDLPLKESEAVRRAKIEVVQNADQVGGTKAVSDL
jgi:hypothetical protein